MASYRSEREKSSERRREHTASGQNIGKIPKRKNLRRWKKCRFSLRLFCEIYLSGKFPLAWSSDHLRMIDKLQAAVLEGGRFAFAMPRGSGKSTLIEAAGVWALLYGHRSFVVILGATEQAAEEMLDSVRIELETNEMLLEDFPETCYPIACLEGEARRCGGQHVGGERTRVSWTQKELVLPTVKGSVASGSVIRVAGITGRIRGMKAATADGRSIRPDLVLADDLQTDESARSPSQNAYREKILSGAVLGLAGPKKKISCVLATTVIAPGDMADRTLDSVRHPEWNGERAKLVYAFPKNVGLWDKYSELRSEGMRSGDGGKEATEFYRANQTAMDAGAVVAWPERFNPDEISALQHAMNWRIDNPRAFAAEAQNEPEDELASSNDDNLEPDPISRKLNRCPRGEVPPECTRLTAGIDVQKHGMFWVVAGWSEQFGGAVIDYGVYPKQNRSYFAYSDIRPGLADLPELNGYDETARVYAGLKATVNLVLGRVYPGSGAEHRIGLCCVDCGYNTDLIHQFIRQSPFAALLQASMGYGIGAKGNPMSSWPKKVGERRDHAGGWVMRRETGGRRTCIIDTNTWKTFVAARLLTPPGGVGSMTLFGTEPSYHHLFADHLTSEYRVHTGGRGRELDEWSRKPGKPDNHWFDCLVMATVAASLQGLTWSASAASGEPTKPAEPKKKKVSMADMYYAKNPGERRV